MEMLVLQQFHLSRTGSDHLYGIKKSIDNSRNHEVIPFLKNQMIPKESKSDTYFPQSWQKILCL